MSRGYMLVRGGAEFRYVKFHTHTYTFAHTHVREIREGRFWWVLVLGQHSRGEVTLWSSEPMEWLNLFIDTTVVEGRPDQREMK